MSYNFDKVINRRETNSYKWDISADEVPMWVADMDFQTPVEIKNALLKRVEQGAFGYTYVPDEYFSAYQNWWKDRHDVELKKEWMIFSTGAVPAISSIVRKITNENDKVVVMSPIYNIFYNSIRNNNRVIVESPLRYENYHYEVSWVVLEKILADPDVKLMIFCNPHNPTGKVWSHEELRRIGELCLKYDVKVLSDEVHCDLTHVGAEYTSFLNISEEISENTIAILAASKAFNLAGLQSATVVVPNEELRRKVDRGLNTDEVAEPNAFCITANIAALNESGEWLDELNNYLEENRKYLVTKLAEYFPEIKVVDAQATYLAWLDCSDLVDDTTLLVEYIRKNSGLVLSDGDIFGGNGAKFIRWNYACPRELLIEGVSRFVSAVESWKKGDIN